MSLAKHFRKTHAIGCKTTVRIVITWCYENPLCLLKKVTFTHKLPFRQVLYACQLVKGAKILGLIPSTTYDFIKIAFGRVLGQIVWILNTPIGVEPVVLLHH